MSNQSNQQDLLQQSIQKTKYKRYIILGSISVIVFGIIGYFIYKKFKNRDKEKVDCQLSGWMYTDCICDSGSSNGYIYRTQTILKEAENGGIACPSSDNLRQVVKQCNCSIPTSTPNQTVYPTSTPNQTMYPTSTPHQTVYPTSTPYSLNIYGSWISENDSKNEIIINNDNTMLWKTEYSSYQNYLYDPISGKYCFNNRSLGKDCSPSNENSTFKISDNNINQAINTIINSGFPTTIIRYNRVNS
jgi:hypothetical protein